MIRDARIGASLFRIRSMSERLLQSLREAVLTLLAMLGTLASTSMFEPGAAAAILGAVLSMSLARSHLFGARRGARTALLALPLVALASVGVGGLIRHAPWAGASVFAGSMALSIWVRRFGLCAQRIGSLVALPLVTILVVPGLPRHESGALTPLLAPVAIALVALAWVIVAQALGRQLSWLAPEDVVGVEPQHTGAPGTVRSSPHTRMALQMAAALAASFAAGYVMFPSHWNWIVLTAFIVNSGNRGRQDVIHKSVLRARRGGRHCRRDSFRWHGRTDGAMGCDAGLASVFLGIWLRPAGYGWWALFVTLALALLQTLQPEASAPLLWQRLLEILIGATIGLAAAWFVLPIRSTDVLRRRIADALATMSEALDPQATERRPDRIVAAIRRVEQLRPSFHGRQQVLRRWQPLQPVDWIDALSACEAPVVALVERGQTPGVVRMAVGAARKALREPALIEPALSGLLQELHAAQRPPSVSPIDES